MSRQLNSRRINRVAQMTMQEELIEKKKREILEKQKAIELTKLMTTTVPCPAAEFKNNFISDGSFLENFKKLTQSAHMVDVGQRNGTDSTGQLGSDPQEPQALQQRDQASTEQTLPTLPTTVDHLVDLVAEKGDGFEASLRSSFCKTDTTLWFLFDKNCKEYLEYRNRVVAKRKGTGQEKYDPEEALELGGGGMDNAEQQQTGGVPEKKTEDIPSVKPSFDDEEDNTEDSDTEYRREAKERNLKNMKSRLTCHYEDSDSSSSDQTGQKYEGSRYNGVNFPDHSNKRKEMDSDSSSKREKRKKSRWGEKVETPANPPLKSIDRTNPDMLKLAVESFGTLELSEEDWKRVEEQFKVNLLYNEMLAKRQEIDRLAKSGRNKYEYDSDEEDAGGTWEHKMRKAEMETTKPWTDATNQVAGRRHHIGDFLPPHELKKFMEQYNKKKSGETPSDYKEHKIKEDNKGFQMLQKLGWKEGEGLGASGSGIVDPINKASQRESNQGLGANVESVPDEDDNEYDAYRKRMMLAYRFRPNPLNNPRRAYY